MRARPRGDTPTATISEVVDGFTFNGGDYRAHRDQVVERSAGISGDLDRESAAELFDEMREAKTLR